MRAPSVVIMAGRHMTAIGDASRQTLFAAAATPIEQVTGRRVRGVLAAAALHAMAFGVWLTVTTHIEPSPVPTLEPLGITFVMAPVRGVGSPTPRPESDRAEPRAARARPVTVEPLTDPLVAEPPAPVLAAPALDVLSPAVMPAPGDPVGVSAESAAPVQGRSGVGTGGAGESAVPPALGTPGGQSNWAGLVLGRLQQFKRYPAEAQRGREEGVCQVRFTIDRQGRVRDASLIHTSGHALLDREAVALVRRADPLPPPPPEVEGETVTLAVPVEFSLAR